MEVARDIELNISDFLYTDAFDRDPDDEEYEGYTGNEGASATHIYRETVSQLSSLVNSFCLFAKTRRPVE